MSRLRASFGTLAAAAPTSAIRSSRMLVLCGSLAFGALAGCNPQVTTAPANSVPANPIASNSTTDSATSTSPMPADPPLDKTPTPETSAVAPPVAPQSATPQPAETGTPPATNAAVAWQPLFDGKTLANWKSTEFGGEGEVRVEQGHIVLEMGADMTGITWDGKDSPPSMNYELSLEAQRLDGADFFCGLTFMVEKSPCSLIIGGWGGGVVGLSSINGFDASENPTTRFMTFESNHWYKIRLRVVPGKITAWIDDQPVVDQEVRPEELSIRAEVELSKPLGVATWQTKAALRNLQLRRIPASEATTNATPKVSAEEAPKAQSKESSSSTTGD